MFVQEETSPTFFTFPGAPRNVRTVLNGSIYCLLASSYYISNFFI